MKEFIFDQNLINIHYDNQSTIHLIKNPIFHYRSKHIYVRMHVITKVIEEGVISIKKITIAINQTDALIETLAIEKKYNFVLIPLDVGFNNYLIL